MTAHAIRTRPRCSQCNGELDYHYLWGWRHVDHDGTVVPRVRHEGLPMFAHTEQADAPADNNGHFAYCERCQVRIYRNPDGSWSHGGTGGPTGCLDGWRYR